MHPDHTPIPRLQAVFDGAKRFGLTDDEAWRALDESLDEVGGDATISEYFEELVGALARRILCKQRRHASETGRVTPEEIP
jgi:hypothetical protein